MANDIIRQRIQAMAKQKMAMNVETASSLSQNVSPPPPHAAEATSAGSAVPLGGAAAASSQTYASATTMMPPSPLSLEVEAEAAAAGEEESTTASTTPNSPSVLGGLRERLKYRQANSPQSRSAHGLQPQHDPLMHRERLESQAESDAPFQSSNASPSPSPSSSLRSQSPPRQPTFRQPPKFQPQHDPLMHRERLESQPEPPPGPGPRPRAPMPLLRVLSRPRGSPRSSSRQNFSLNMTP